jgi:hypothetical protein
VEDGLYARSLARAAELLGGVDKLAAQLNVPQSYLKLWMKGADKPPVEVFLRVVDFLMEEKLRGQGEPGATSSEHRARAKSGTAGT